MAHNDVLDLSQPVCDVCLSLQYYDYSFIYAYLSLLRLRKEFCITTEKMKPYEKMDKYLKSSFTAPSAANGVMTLFEKEKVIGVGGTGIVATYRSNLGERVVLKVSYCNNPQARQIGTAEMETALDASDPSKTHCPQPGQFPLCNSCGYTADNILRRPLSYSYEAPCFYAVFPYVESNLAQWLQKNPIRDPQIIRDFFMQILSILRCLRTRKYYYCDIKASNFLVQTVPGKPPRIEIGDLGGISQYGSNQITITTGQLPESMRQSLSWKNIDAALSMLLGEILLQMMVKTPTASDTIAPVVNFFACIQDQKKSICEKSLLEMIENDLAHGISLQNPLCLDMLCVSFMLIGYKDMKLDWQDVVKLHSSINVI